MVVLENGKICDSRVAPDMQGKASAGALTGAPSHADFTQRHRVALSDAGSATGCIHAQFLSCIGLYSSMTDAAFDSTQYTFTTSQRARCTPSISCLALHIRLRRLASGLGSLGLDSSVAQLLDLALLAVLRARQSCVLPCSSQTSAPLSTHLPLGEPELALAAALGNDALLLLERAAHDARGDRNVAVVAVTGCQRRGSGRREGIVAYERPAAFHANAIVMVGRVFVGLGFAGCGWGWRC
jgi:hypothetical protein